MILSLSHLLIDNKHKQESGESATERILWKHMGCYTYKYIQIHIRLKKTLGK